MLKDRWADFYPICSTKPNIDQEQFSSDNVPICSVPIFSTVAHKSSVHLRPNLFHIAGFFYCTSWNFEGEGAAITEFWESERGRGWVIDTEKIQTKALVFIHDYLKRDTDSDVQHGKAAWFLSNLLYKVQYK